MKKFLLFLIISLASFIGFGQGFIKLYKSSISGFQPDGQGGFIASAIYYNQPQSSFVWYNSKGDSLRGKPISQLIYGAYDIIKTVDNGYLLVGYQSLVKVDGNANVVWSQPYTSNGRLFEDINGDYLIYGGGLVKYTKSGSLLWNKTYNYISIGGMQSYSNGYIVAGTNNNAIVLAKCNYDGDTIATRKYAISGAAVKGLIKLTDGNYMANINNTIVKFNENLDTLLTRKITASPSIKSSVVSGKDNIFLSQGPDILKYDANMNKVWNYKTPGNILEFTPLEDGGVVVTCSTFVNPYRTALVRIDRNGKVYDNFIKGKITIDANANCVTDAGEKSVSNVLIKSVPNFQYAFTDDNGNYEIPVDTGITYTVSPVLPLNDFLVNNCTASYSEIVHQKGIDIVSKDFNLTKLQCANLKVYYYEKSVIRCFNGKSQIYCYNSGSIEAQNVQIQLELPDIVEIKSTTAPYTKSGNKYLFDLGNIASNSYKVINISDYISCMAELGDEFYVRAIASTSSTIACANWSSDTSITRFTVRGSFDPNDKNVFPAALNFNDYINGEKELQYRINFQNTGLSEAINVKIIDTLSNQLDLESIKDIVSSHSVSMEILNEDKKIIVWNFKDINLPAESANEVESHGFVSFAIRLADGIEDNSIVSNKAAILFDYNSPIITNEATVDISSNKSTEEFVEGIITQLFSSIDSKYSFVVSPNPISEYAEIEVNPIKENLEFTLVNSHGLVVDKFSFEGGKGRLFKKNLIPGIYYYFVVSDQKTIGSGKVVIR